MDKKDEENIEIDFGKFKSFFKRENKDVKGETPKIEIKDNDEEISIDFGKIRNFFKGKKVQEQVVSSKETAEGKLIEKVQVNLKDKDDDEIQIDFKKIKNIFKSEDKEQKEEDITIDWKKAGIFFRKYGIFFLALIPIILSIYVRMQAGYLPVTDEWATNAVMNSIRAQISSQVGQNYPNLPEANRNTIIDGEMNKYVSDNKAPINQQIKATSDYYRAFFLDENGKNYMPDIDPYYWLRYAKNIVDHGHPGDIIKDGKEWDNHQLAPIGRPVQPDKFHEYYLAYFWKSAHLFIPSLSLERSLFYYPVIISALCVLLVFLIARKIAGNMAGFFAGLIMAVNSAFLGRTLFGHADSDTWVVFFPLIITWLFVESFDIKKLWKVAALAGLCTGLFAFTWSGWWFIFDFLLVTLIATLFYLFASNFSEIKTNAKHIINNIKIRNVLLFSFVYFASAAMFVALFMGWGEFFNSFSGPLNFQSIKSPVGRVNLWPNVLTTVAELNEGSINSAISSIGGNFLFFISLLGIIMAVSKKEGLKKLDYVYIVIFSAFYALYFAYRKFSGSDSSVLTAVWIFAPIVFWIFISLKNRHNDYDFHLSILLAIWIVATIFASVRGIRFTLMIAPAFSVAFGVALGKIYEFFTELSSSALKIHKKLGSVIILILLITLFISPTRAAISGSGRDIPLVNDAWHNALIKIRDNSKNDAIITSWWDFGHHFKAIADRPVTFDGTTQTSPAAHWVGKLLMTNNENEAMGILRMLDCGSSKGFNAVQNVKQDFHISIKIIDEIILLEKKDAEKKLKSYGIANDEIENVLQYTHCNPPEGFFIASEDMIGKSGVWGHFGSWNFERADIWQKAKNMEQDEAVDYIMNKFNYTKENAESVYFEVLSITSDAEANTWIASWPGYGGTTNCNKKENRIFACDNGFTVNMTSMDIYGVAQQGISRPKSGAFTTKNGMIIKKFDGASVEFGATVIPENENQLLMVLSSKELAGSMFTRMFYMEGHGLKYFKLFDHQRGLTGTDIYTYKVDWQGSNTTIADKYVAALSNISSSK